MVAFAVRQAFYLISIHNISIRDGGEYMTEYDLASNLIAFDIGVKPQGWARRPVHGEQYGCSYCTIWTRDS